ncbi:MAG: ADP-ribose-binding protein [Denitrovibrio sp.]|nr:MAG: ADP-ribose-binding protein [Denitrovibrio sp.]
MKFQTANLLDYVGTNPVVITTNGTIKKDGKANLGRGNAKELGKTLDWLAEKLGILIRDGGNHVHHIDNMIVSFPVEETWTSHADLKLVERSAKELVRLVELYNWEKVYMPLPGCGGGGLKPSDVISTLAPILDDRFIILNKGEIPKVL